MKRNTLFSSLLLYRFSPVRHAELDSASVRNKQIPNQVWDDKIRKWFNMKVVFLLFLFIIFIFRPAFAAEKTNKFGIHIAEVSDVKDAAALVNGSGGD